MTEVTSVRRQYYKDWCCVDDIYGFNRFAVFSCILICEVQQSRNNLIVRITGLKRVACERVEKTKEVVAG